MRTGWTNVAGAALAAAVAVAGCGSLAKNLGFTDQVDRDWSADMSRSNTYLAVEPPSKVLVQEFKADLTAPKPKVLVVLKNEGEVKDLFSVDLQFGYPAEEGSFAEFETESVPIDIPNFKQGDVFKREFSPPAKAKGTPLFARLVTDVWATTDREVSVARKETRQGTLLLDERVEVVSVEGDLTAEKPTLSFTLENVDALNGAKPVGDLQYKIEFYTADGRKAVPLGPFFKGLRPVGSALGAKGSKVVLHVTRLETVPGSLAGTKPVLRLVPAQ